MLCGVTGRVKTWFTPTSRATMSATRPNNSENVIVVVLLNEFKYFGKVSVGQVISDVYPTTISSFL